MQRNHFNGRMLVTVIIVSAGVLVPAVESWANGIIVGPGPIIPELSPPRIHRPIRSWMPFRIKSQSVNIEINDALAETAVEQVFINRSGGQAEGTYLFPIPVHAGVHTFTMWMNGREVRGELLDADRARQIYESIVSKMRDPGLLQFAGRGLIQAKVFPIPAGGECRIKLQYSEPVRVDSGLAAYRFPLGSSGCRFEPIERFSLRAVVRSKRSRVSVFSPTHECSIDQRSDREVVVGLEKQRLQPEEDFQLYTKLGDEAFGLSFLAHRVSGEEGFFMARIAPQLSRDGGAVLPKNICFVLDTSGSMADSNKIAQAKNALKFCITNLDREDRFSVLTFATEVRSFRAGWSGADEETKSAARTFIDRLKAVGGTDINAALQKALSLNPNRDADAQGAAGDSWRMNPYFIVFITDGEPTVGVTNPEAILKNVANANQGRPLGSLDRPILKTTGVVKESRVFVLGVGYQVNTKLLDRLADENGGARGYVTPQENLELKISAFYTKLANPVLASPQLTFKGVAVHDVYPRQLPDLFKGSELIVVGRYGAANALSLGQPRSQKIALTGYCRGEARGYTFACDFPVVQRQHDFLPRVWAMRRIGFLLDELRLHGENKELKNEVIRLAKEYGILTPYTSFLVQQDEQLAARHGRAPIGPRSLATSIKSAWEDRDEEMKEAARGQRLLVGRISVDASNDNQTLQSMKPAKSQPMRSSVASGNRGKDGRSLINFIGARTFYWEDGRWIDADYDGQSATTKLTAYSQDYFDFLAKNREAGQYLAQGDRVVLNWQGQIYETVPSEPAEESAVKEE
ncbi:MAG: VIT and VWA domain-containing protein [Phycisphaerales bacterium]|nr:VIT and VWA domain-containing protein [Phycisphaerales bacterium]